MADGYVLSERLIKEDGTHPEFPGPSFWHFRKDRKAFRRFASELVVERPLLLQLPIIGRDLDKAQILGFTTSFDICLVHSTYKRKG